MTKTDKEKRLESAKLAESTWGTKKTNKDSFAKIKQVKLSGQKPRIFRAAGSGTNAYKPKLGLNYNK